MTDFEEMVMHAKDFEAYNRNIIGWSGGTIKSGLGGFITINQTIQSTVSKIPTDVEVNKMIEDQAEITRKATANIIAQKDEEIKQLHDDINILKGMVFDINLRLTNPLTGEINKVISKQDFDDLAVKYNNLIETLQQEKHCPGSTQHIDLRGFKKYEY